MITSIFRTCRGLVCDHAGDRSTGAYKPGNISRADFLGLMASGLAAAGVGLFTSQAAAQTMNAVAPVTDLDAVYDAWQERFNAGDLDGLLALYAADVSYINPQGVALNGEAAVRADYKALLDLKPKIDIVDRKHVVYQNIALTTNHWTLELTDASGALQKATGGGIEVVRNQDNAGWLFIIDDASRSAS